MMEPRDRGRGGRPTKAEGPRVPYEEVDKILVFGEIVPVGRGDETTIYFPSYREIAERYGVSNSVISDYAKSRNVQRRRKEAQARVQAKVEQKVVELRATAIAFSKEDELRIIDSYLAGFEKAIAEERVRFDNPADFNTMVRLKEFVMGNADSRQEINASLSLEVLQTRHRQMMRTVDVSPAERGEVLPPAPPPTQALGERDNLSPAAAVSDGVQQLHTRFAVGSGESERASAPVGSGAARDEAAEESRGVPLRDAHERAHENVRPLSGATIGDDEGESRGNREDDHETPRAPEPDAEHAAPHELEHQGDDAVADTLRPAPPRPEEP
jgi:hypothetical protein